MIRFTRSRILLFVSILFILAASWAWISHTSSLKELVVTYKNIDTVSVYKKGVLKPVQENIKSGQPIKLPKGDYVLLYKGVGGYENNQLLVKLFSNKSVFINPNYSSSRLKSLLKSESININAVLAANYPGYNQYLIANEKLYAKGEWYGVKLKYIGDDYYNSDPLRLVMYKDNDRWLVKTNPPNISLSKINYNNIPLYILKDVNNF